MSYGLCILNSPNRKIFIIFTEYWKVEKNIEKMGKVNSVSIPPSSTMGKLILTAWDWLDSCLHGIVDSVHFGIFLLIKFQMKLHYHKVVPIFDFLYISIAKQLHRMARNLQCHCHRHRSMENARAKFGDSMENPMNIISSIYQLHYHLRI